MEVLIPAYARTIRERLRLRPARRAAEAPACPAQAQPARALQPVRRPLGRLFQRPAAPTTFQRCLAVHIHFAQRASALD
jgi:hypothetical protein